MAHFHLLSLEQVGENDQNTVTTIKMQFNKYTTEITNVEITNVVICGLSYVSG